MKKLIQLLSFLVFGYASAQITFAPLLEAQLINEKDKIQLHQILQQFEKTTPATMVLALQQLHQKKLTGFTDSSDTNINYSTFPYTTEDKKQLLLWNQQLWKSKVLNTAMYNEQLTKINNDRYRHYLEYFQHLLNTLGYRELISKPRLKQFALQLKNLKLLTPSKHADFLRSIHTVKSPLDLLKFCSNATVFDLAAYPKHLTGYLEKIHHKTAALLPSLAFENFDYQIKPHEVIDDGQEIYCSLTIDGTPYHQKSFYLSHRELDNSYEYFGKVDHLTYLAIFNKALRDQGSAVRLFSVSSLSETDLNTIDHRYYGVIALNKKQYEQLNNFMYGQFWLLSHSIGFDNQFNTKVLQEFQEKLLRLNLLSATSAKALKQQTQCNPLNSVYDLFTYTPELTCPTEYDFGDYDSPLKAFITALKKISRGAFTPEKIQLIAQPNPREQLIVFQWNNEHHSIKLTSDKPDLLPQINTILQRTGSRGKFYQIGNFDQQWLLFLTDIQYQELQQDLNLH